MRKIKFRAWDGKQFFYWGFYVGSKAWFTGPPNRPSAKHEQFTGLYDKNGKEIYEGDIVHCVRMADSNAFEAWTNYDGYDPETKAIPFEIRRDEQGIDIEWPCDIRWNPYWWEIIGNIHENPELMEEG